MDGNTIGFLAIGALIVGNIILVAYTSGKYAQKIEDLGARVTRLENKIFNGRKEN